MPARRTGPSLPAAAAAVWRRELTESLRDSYVLIFSVGFPLLFYPLLVWGAMQVMMLQDGTLEWSPPRVAVVATGAEAGAVAELESGLDEAIFEDGRLVSATVGEAGPAALDDPEAGVDVVVVATVDAARWTAAVHHLSTRSRSAAGARLVGERLEALRETREAQLVDRAGLGADALAVWDWEAEDVAPRGQLVGRMLGLMLPTVLLASMMISGIYPAVEILVAEKERRTIETTLVSAAPRAALVLGKLGALVTLIAVSALGNLGAMVLTLLQVFSASGMDTAGVAPSLAPGPVAAAVALLLVQAVLGAALLALVTLPAKTFKQGQTVASLVGTAGMMPAMVTMMPTIELGWGMALVPVCNTALVVREAVGGTGAAAGPLALAFAVNIGLTVVLLGISLALARREETWFGAGQGRVQRWIARLSGEGSG